MDTSDNDTQHQALIKEDQALRDAIVNVTLSWSNLENRLALILGSVIDPRGPNTYAFAIFYSVVSADAKIGVVDAVFTTLAQTSPYEAKICELWRKVLNRISRAKKTRNIVAHGQITTVFLHGKNHVRLTPPMFDWRRMGPPMLTGQLPGLSSHDIRLSAKRMSNITLILDRFFPIIEALNAKNDQALLEQLQVLEAGMKKDHDQETG